MQSRGLRLSMVQHPLQEVLDDFAVVGILCWAGNQQPGEAGDRIGVLARGIGDGDAVIGRDLRSCRGRAHALGRGLQPIS